MGVLNIITVFDIGRKHGGGFCNVSGKVPRVAQLGLFAKEAGRLGVAKFLIKRFHRFRQSGLTGCAFKKSDFDSDAR
jgi:hypothetical protein